MNISKVDGMQIEKYNQTDRQTDSRDSFLDFVKGILVLCQDLVQVKIRNFSLF